MISGRRVLCGAALPNLGHAIPVAALALEFKRAGNDVAMITDAGMHADFYQRLGLSCVDLGAHTTDAPQSLAMMLSLLDDFDPDITVADWRRDLWLAQYVGRPRCRISILRSENFIGYVRKSPYLPDIYRMHTPDELSFLRRFRQAPITDPKLLYRTEVIVLPSTPELDPLPPDVTRNYPRSTFVYTGPLRVEAFGAAPDNLPAWSAQERERGRPVVLITTGTAWGRDFCLDLAANVGRLRFSCVLAIPRQETRALIERYSQPHLLIVEGADLSHLLPHCDVAIHHGGHGTLQAAILAGKPSVTIPSYQYDREDNALRLEALGCGIHLNDGLYRGGLDVEQLNDAVALVLGDERIMAATARMSRRLSDFIAERGPAYLLKTLDEQALVPARPRRRARRPPKRRHPVPAFPWLRIHLYALRERLAQSRQRRRERRTGLVPDGPVRAAGGQRP